MQRGWKLTTTVLMTGLAVALLPASAGIAEDSEIELTVYSFDGIYRGDQKVKITGGSTDVSLSDLKGKTRRFDMTLATFNIADTNDDGYQDFRDIAAGDKLEIKSNLKKRRPGAPPYPATAVRDLTHPRPPRT